MGKYRELIGGCGFFLFGAAYFIAAFSIRKFDANGVIDSAFIPKIYGILIMILSSLQLLVAIWKKKIINKDVTEKNNDEGTLRQRLFAVLKTFALLIIYIALLGNVGFVIMSIFFIIAMTMLLLPQNQFSKRKIIMVTGIAVVFSVAVYLLFVYGFGLTLPAGILEL